MKTQEIAAQAYQLGLCPVRLHPRAKRPIAKEWNRVTRQNLDLEDFSEGENVGILWGPESGGVVDVDIDNDLACSLASQFLPQTFVYGHTSRPRSHYLYRVSEAIKRQTFQNEGGGIVIELRGVGCQSVWPGSIHPDGHLYEVNEDREWADIEVGDLKARLHVLVAATRLLECYPKTEGQRHDFVHAATGAIARVSDATLTRRIMQAVVLASSDPDPAQRFRTIESTLESSGTTAGWPTLAGIAGQGPTEGIRRALQAALAEKPLEASGDVEIHSLRDVLKATMAQEPERLIDGTLTFTPGAYVLAGKPKEGKSWLAMGIALAFATGEPYCGMKFPKPGPALYCSFDDTNAARFGRR
ncbi:MAG: bifunctional DNA primase/polymerase, partial [Chromatiaceae bacterium]|nr:bifunctional DNA primase/polymerase [Candidatus Thioaporhodococcus sediminis]